MPVNGGFENETNLTTDWTNPSGLGSYAIVPNARTGNNALGYSTSLVASSSTQSINPALPIAVNNGYYFHAIAWTMGSNASAKLSLGVASTGSAIASGTPATNSNYNNYERKSYNYQNTTGNTQNWMIRLRGATATSGTNTTIFVDDVIMYSDLTATADLTKPASPTNFTSGTVTSSSIVINWTNGNDAETGLQQTIILRTTNSTASIPIMNDQAVYSNAGGILGPNTVSGDWTVVSTSVETTSSTFTDNSVTGGTSYKYAIVHRDLAYNYSVSLVSGTITTPVNPSKPNAPTNFNFGKITSNEVEMAWTNGNNTGITMNPTLILRTTNLNALAPVLSDNTVYTVSNSIADWTVLSTSVNATATSFTDNTASANTSYLYAVIHCSSAVHYSAALVSSNLKTELSFASQNIFSVLEYGADATGLTDSSPAFQAAINALNTKGYGTFYMPQGIYVLNSQVGINGSSMLFEIKGDGIDKTIIKCNNSTGGIRIYSSNRSSQITIHDFSMVPMLANSGTAFEYTMLSGGNRENRSCIVENVTIQSSVSNSFSKGMNLTGQWRTLAKNITISGSPFSTTAVMTVGIDVTESYTPRVINSTVNNANEGILYISDAGQSGDFVGNTLTKCNLGIRLSQFTGVQPHVNVESNTFDCYQYGLKIESRKIIFVKNNTFSNLNATPGSDYYDLHIELTDGANQDVSDILVVNNTFTPSSNTKRVMIYLGNTVSNIFVRKNTFNSSGTEFSVPNNSPLVVFEDNSIKAKTYFDEKFDSYSTATTLSDPITNWFVNLNQNTGSAPTISTAIGFPAGTTNMATLQEQLSVVSSNKYRMEGKKLSNEGVNVVGPQQKLYAAALIKVNSIGTGSLSGSWFFALSDSTFTRSRGKIFVVSSGTGYKFALAKGNDTFKVTDATVRTFGVPQLLVIKYDVNSSSVSDDSVFLYVNPNMANTEPLTPTLNANIQQESSLDFLFSDIISAVLFQKGPSVQIGGIKVANDWSELAANITTTFNVQNPSQTPPIYYRNGNLVTQKNGNLKVFSLQGTELYNGFSTGKFAINLTKGIYITQFIDEFGNKSTEKVTSW
jgi:hypothetical protein